MGWGPGAASLSSRMWWGRPGRGMTAPLPRTPPFLHWEAVTLGAPVRVGSRAFFLGFAALS